MEKKFCKFLIKIGMIDEDTSSTFIKIYKDIFRESPNINIFELSFQILITFLNNLTNSQKNYMCHNLPLKFYEIREKNKRDKLISIIIKNRLKNKINLLKHLFTWKKNSKNNPKDKMISYKNRTINTFNKSNSSFKRSNQTSSSTIYKIQYPNYHSNANIIDEKIDYITEHDKISIDNNTYNKSNSHLFLSNTTKNSQNSGIKKYYNCINKINYKELNKSASGDKLISSKRDKKSLTINNSRSSNNIINTTWAYKEQKELKECTFKPKINNLKKSNNGSKTSNKEREEELQSRFEKLYKDDIKYKISKEIKALEYDHYTNKELTFNPNINNNPNLLKEERKEKFENRIKSYIDIKNKHHNEIQNKINEEFSKKYSFSPKINKSYSNNSLFTKTINEKNESEYTIPAYIRLYQESKLRNQKQIQRKKEVEQYVNSLSNSLIKTISVVNLDKINELYENKEKSKNNEKIKNKVESEEGVTFKPYIYKNRFSKNIFSNFYERNSRFLEDKEKFIVLHQSVPNPNSKKKISQNEKKEIVKNIVDRLYNESKSGTLSNNSIGCNKYIKSVQGSYNNIHKLENKKNNNFEGYNLVE